MYCILIPRKQWEKIVDKFYILLFEFRDLVNHLEYYNEENSFDLLEEKFEKIKKENNYCLNCFGEVEEDDEEFCVCEECEDCMRKELCFCLK